ncbi:MAG: flagellar export chaperone FliS [Planctomycetes bacterium]|nr:flagellar export chaperone FliS [Planctomycetota bacterium]
MNLRGARGYLETQIKTASKEQLLLMLYDGAIRFAEQAKAKIDEKDIEGSYNLLIKSQNIVLELMCCLDKAIGEELYSNLMRLYNFIYSRLVEANIKKQNTLVEEGLVILRQLRETWSEAIEKNRKEEEAAPVATTGTAPNAPSAPVPAAPAAPSSRPAAAAGPRGYSRQPMMPNVRSINVEG